MGMYFGSKKVRFALGNMPRRLNLISVQPAVPNIFLVSSDGYVLKDCNGVYLTVKERE